MLSLGARILYVIVAVAHVAVSFPVVAQSKTISPRISAGMRAKAIEVAADKQLLDYGKFLGTLSPSDKAKINCRGARIFEKRAELIWASIGEIAGASRALGEARKRLATNVDVLCKGGADPKLQNVATPMQLALQAANATLTNGTIARDVPDLIFFSIADRIARFDRLCSPRLQALSPEHLLGMSDSQFETELPSIAYGRCSSGSKFGLASAFDRLQQPTGYAQCVNEALAETYRKPAECNPVSDEDALQRIRDELAAARAANDAEEVARLQAEEAQQMAYEREVAEISRQRSVALSIGGIGLVLGGVGLIVLGAVATTGSVGLGAPVGVPTAAMGVAMIGAGFTAFGVGSHDTADIDRNLAQRGVSPPRLCPGFDSPLGTLAFARSEGRGKGDTLRPRRNGFGLERVTVLDVMHECHCQNDPMNSIPGLDSRCELSDKIACLREKDDDVRGTGRFNPRCHKLLMEDNPERISQQLQQCQVTQCPEGQMIGTDCRCHAGGRMLRFDPRRSAPVSPLCGTVRCPEGQVPSGPTCACRSRDGGPEPLPLPVPQGPDAGPTPMPTPPPSPGR